MSKQVALTSVSKRFHFTPISSLSSDARPKSAPKLILLFAWMGARLNHAQKYVNGYHQIWPSTPIILVQSLPPDFRPFSRFAKDYTTLVTLLEQHKIDLTDPEDGKHVLMATMSNGGCWGADALCQSLSKNAVLRPRALIMDSCPGLARYSATLKAFLIAGKYRLFSKAIATVVISIYYCISVVFNTLIFNDPIEKMRASSLQRIIAQRRTYIYSKEDDLIYWKDVEAHAYSSQRSGQTTKTELFHGSGHVQHLRSDEERYWKIVQDTWDPFSANTQIHAAEPDAKPLESETESSLSEETLGGSYVDSMSISKEEFIPESFAAKGEDSKTEEHTPVKAEPLGDSYVESLSMSKDESTATSSASEATTSKLEQDTPVDQKSHGESHVESMSSTKDAQSAENLVPGEEGKSETEEEERMDEKPLGKSYVESMSSSQGDDSDLESLTPEGHKNSTPVADVASPDTTTESSSTKQSAPEESSVTESNDLDPSILGTKEYWENIYRRERANYAENKNDEGEIWFGEDAEDKIVRYLERNHPQDKKVQLLDLGTGNGHLLFKLAEEGFTNWNMVGIDYSEHSIELARAIAVTRKSKNIQFRVQDFLDELVSPPSSKFDVVIDKGTFDAISLSDQRTSRGKKLNEIYAVSVARFMKPNAKLIITSCNWTTEELIQRLTADKVLKVHAYFKKPKQSFSFGGRTGTTTSSVCFALAYPKN